MSGPANHLSAGPWGSIHGPGVGLCPGESKTRDLSSELSVGVKTSWMLLYPWGCTTKTVAKIPWGKVTETNILCLIETQIVSLVPPSRPWIRTYLRFMNTTFLRELNWGTRKLFFAGDQGFCREKNSGGSQFCGDVFFVAREMRWLCERRTCAILCGITCAGCLGVLASLACHYTLHIVRHMRLAQLSYQATQLSRLLDLPGHVHHLVFHWLQTW